MHLKVKDTGGHAVAIGEGEASVEYLYVFVGEDPRTARMLGLKQFIAGQPACKNLHSFAVERVTMDTFFI